MDIMDVCCHIMLSHQYEQNLKECFQHIIESTSQRFKAVVKSKGGPIQYQQPNTYAPNELVHIGIGCKAVWNKNMMTQYN